MVEFDLIIPHRLMTTLANLPVAANDLQHDLSRNGTAVSPSVSRFSKGFRYEKYRAQMAKNLARGFGEYFWYDFGMIARFVCR